MVQEILKNVFELIVTNLNTSHVMVQAPLVTHYFQITLHLNTSHVMVQVETKNNTIIETKLFKYISCYGSSNNSKIQWEVLTRFKYISCYGSSYRRH